MSIVAICINGIALYAIVERINEYGFSANRLAVLGSNVLMFIHLVLTSIQLLIATFSKNSTFKIQETIVNYLPIYLVWMIFVCFAFPILFK